MEKSEISESGWLELFQRETLGSKGNMAVSHGLFISDKIFIDDFSLQGSIAVSFKNCTFKKKFSFSQLFPKPAVYLTACIFEGDVFLGSIESQNKIDFLNCSIGQQMVISKITVNTFALNLTYARNIVFDNESFISHIQIGGLNKNKIDQLTLPASCIGKRFEINHADVGDLYIHSVLGAEMIIANCHINKISFDNFRNNVVLKFLNCRSLENETPSELTINQSNMGKSEFFKFNFASFSIVNITNSVVLESLFINSAWSKNNMTSKTLHFHEKLATTDDVKKEVLADNLKEVYKQIKYALSNQGDNVQEQFFHGLEMNEYDKSLPWKKHFWTKLILKLSYATSNYGQSFLLPFIWLIGLSALLFLFLYLLGATKFSTFDVLKFQNYPDTFASIINLMNPLYKFDKDLTGTAFIVDTCSRVFSSYFIYNIIRATRRFVK